MEALRKQIMDLSKAMGASYLLNDKMLSYDEVFADEGMLPAIARRADQLCSLCLGYGIGVSFEESEKSRLGNKVIFDDVTPNVLRLLCIADVLAELIAASPSPERTALDELMYD